MSLLELPNELLRQILEELFAEKDIASFARVDRRLHRLTIAYLYRFNAEHTESSALLWAATKGVISTAKRALKETQISVSDDEESTPPAAAAVVLAARNNHLDMVRLLIGSGVDPHSYDEDQERNAMEIAAEEGHTEMIKLLLELGAHPAEGFCIKPFAIQFAAMQGNVDIVRLLVDAGADPDSCSGRPGGGSFSPLQAAALTDNEDLAILLLEKGARVNHRSRSGDTPLELAVAKNSLRCLKVLLKSGAKVYGACGRYISRPALESAKEPGHEQCLELLKNETVHVYLEKEDDRFAHWYA